MAKKIPDEIKQAAILLFFSDVTLTISDVARKFNLQPQSLSNIVHRYAEKNGLKEQLKERSKIALLAGGQSRRGKKQLTHSHWPKEREEERRPLATEKIDVQLLLEMTFGKRLRRTSHALYLDGIPTNINDLVRRMNRIRKNMGQPQIDYNPKWVV